MSLDFGPQFGYMINARGVVGGNTHNLNDWDALNKFDFSLLLGVSFRLNDSFSLGLRSTAGVTNAVEISDRNFTNTVSQISLAVRF